MEAVDLQRREELLERYNSLRHVGRKMHLRMAELLDREEIHEAADRLGMLRGETIVLDTEDMISVVMDFALLHLRRDGQNAVQRYLRDAPPRPGSDARVFLEARACARYRILQVVEPHPGFGLTVRDMLRDEEGLLMDVAFSRCGKQGFICAGHFLALPSFWMCTGASLPLTPAIVGALTRKLLRRFGKSPRAYRTLSPDQETQLATWTIRHALEAGMAEHIAYA